MQGAFLAVELNPANDQALTRRLARKGFQRNNDKRPRPHGAPAGHFPSPPTWPAGALLIIETLKHLRHHTSSAVKLTLVQSPELRAVSANFCPLTPWDLVSAPVICGTAAGGFEFAFVRGIVKLSTSWSGTTATRIAGAPSWVASIHRADCFPVILADLSTILEARQPQVTPRLLRLHTPVQHGHAGARPHPSATNAAKRAVPQPAGCLRSSLLLALPRRRCAQLCLMPLNCTHVAVLRAGCSVNCSALPVARRLWRNGNCSRNHET